MNMKSGLLGLSLFAAAGMLTISCGGGDEDGGNGTAGKGSGGSSAGTGSPGTSGSATGGSGNNTSGTGNNNGGTGNNNGGTGNNNGGSGNNTGGTGNSNEGGNDNDNEGGNDNGPNCPPTQPTDGAACTESTGQQGCDYAGGDINCRCQRTFGQGPGQGEGGQGAGVTRAWNCEEDDDDGGGNEGGGPNLGDVECPDEKPADEATCTGTGFCPYQGGGCVCINGMFNCL